MLAESVTWFDRLSQNWDLALETGIGWTIISHGINEFPVPDNKYGRWLLSWIQFAVGYRTRSANTRQNQDSVTVSIPKKNGNGGTGNGGGSVTGSNPIPSSKEPL